MARAVSTVLDVAVCLLLVGVAITTLIAGIPVNNAIGESTDADATAARLATVTADVTNRDARVSHGTVASHLATAAVASATIGDAPVDSTSYPESVRNETASITEEQVLITVTWEPYPNAPLRGRLVVGEEPPPDADVAVRTITVDSTLESAEKERSFGTLAAALAERYVDWLFPPERTRTALVDARTASDTAARYRNATTAIGGDTDGPLAAADTRRANAILSSRLAERLEVDLRGHYATPEAATRNVSIDAVEIVVRRWER
jgi:hypothetical protein